MEPPTFYVDPTIVRGLPSVLEPGEEATAEVMAFFLDRRDDGYLIVQIPGEAVSYGPRLVVPAELAAA